MNPAEPRAPQRLSATSGFQARSFQTIDERYAALADEIPDFGGLFYDQAERLNVYLKDTTAGDRSRPQLAAFLTREQGGRHPELVAARLSNMRILRGKYNFRELLTLYRNSILPSIADLPTVTITDIEDSRNDIVIGVSSPEAIETVQSRVRAAGSPSGLVRVTIEPPVRINSLLTDSLRPIPGGAYIFRLTGTDSIRCTMGYNLVKYLGSLDDTVATDRYFVTASHCSSARNSLDYSQFYQHGGYIGAESGDPSAFTNSYTSACPTGKLCRWADASLFTYVDPSLANLGKVAYTGLGSLSFSGFATVTAVQGPAMGYTVNMVGAASGRTFGTVTLVCADATNISGWTNGDLLCQDRATYTSQDGDSGAPVISLFSDSTAWAAGLHWGNHFNNGVFQYSWFSPMDELLGEFFDLLPGHPNLVPVQYP